MTAYHQRLQAGHYQAGKTKRGYSTAHEAKRATPTQESEPNADDQATTKPRRSSH